MKVIKLEGGNCLIEGDGYKFQLSLIEINTLNTILEKGVIPNNTTKKINETGTLVARWIKESGENVFAIQFYETPLLKDVYQLPMFSFKTQDVYSLKKQINEMKLVISKAGGGKAITAFTGVNINE